MKEKGLIEVGKNPIDRFLNPRNHTMKLITTLLLLRILDLKINSKRVIALIVTLIAVTEAIKSPIHIIMDHGKAQK